MPIHLRAEPGDYAEACLLPGDPLRAQYIAETFLEDVRQVNAERGLLGFTGTWNGKRVSVQATGMGQPSLAIYVYELLNLYGVKTAIRIVQRSLEEFREAAPITTFTTVFFGAF